MDDLIVFEEQTLESKARLLGSLLLFIQTFYKLIEGRDFLLPQPINRECHVITLCRALTKVFNLEINRLSINIPPGHYKSTIMIYFIAWCFAHFADCRFMYISYSIELATKHTSIIRKIMMHPYYRKLFGIDISRDSSAKDNFTTTAGGSVRAFGSTGSITGQDAGLPGQNRCTGGFILDDMHKLQEIYSDTIRERVIENYRSSIITRARGENAFGISIAQRAHELDLPAIFENNLDGYDWHKIILPARDEVGNILNPIATSEQMLRALEDFQPQVYATQYQQKPTPAGGSLFKKDKFVLLDEEPQIITAFITADTAESTKKHADFTVFSFFGLYKIKNFQRETNEYGLHWLDCLEARIDPGDLEDEFFSFYARCMTHKVKPEFIAIENKSTGVSLLAATKKVRGLSVINIERNAASLSKGDRFFNMCYFINKKLISLPALGRHTAICVNHMVKITPNNTHLHDDIADTLESAIKITYIDKTILSFNYNNQQDEIFDVFNMDLRKQTKYRSTLYGQKH
jgi:hypothetical protein